jgi:TolB-like protein
MPALGTPPTPETSECVRFSDFVFDVAGHNLIREGGEAPLLRRSEFALLAAFIRAPGRVLSRDHLLDAVAGRGWTCFDRSIDVLVSRLRQKIEPDPKSPSLIQTIPGLGYKFTAQPHAIAGPGAAGAPTTIGTAGSVREGHSIAVMPFEDVNCDPAQDRFARGLTAEIITALARLRSVIVIANHSAPARRPTPSDTGAIGRELAARYVLHGCVRQGGDRVRINARLVDSENGVHLWADRFDCDLTDIFDAQDEVATRLAAAIETALLQLDTERPSRDPASDPRAYDLVKRSCLIEAQFTKQGMEGSRRLLHRAIEIDPGCDLARAFLARSSYIMSNRMLRTPSESELQFYFRASRTIAAHGRDDPELLILAATVLGLAADPEEGLRLLDRAQTLVPDCADVWALSGLIRGYCRDTATALSHLERSQRASSLNLRVLPHTGWGYAVAYTAAGRYDDAMLWTWVDRPNDFHNLRARAALLGLLGRIEEARDAVRRLLTLMPGLTVSRVQHHQAVVMKSPFWNSKGGFPRAICEGLRLAGLPE